MQNNLIPVIENHNKNLVVSSRVVAEQLGKEHSKVIRTIEQISAKPDVASLIYLHKYKDNQGKPRKEYLLTKDGFILYMFNIQGHNDFKMAYINKFNEMEHGILANKELDIKYMRAEAMLLNARLRQAKFLEKHSKLSPQSASVAVGAGIQPLSDSEYFSASDIAKELGVSSNKIGRIANKHNLKIDKYGIYVLDKSPYSSKQVEAFRYKQAGRHKIKELLGA